MATENIRIKYEVDKKQLEASNRELKKTEKGNKLTGKEVDKTTKKFKDQNKQLASTNKEMAGLGGQLTALGNRFSIAGKGAGDMAAGMFKASKATTGMSKSLKVLKVALIATGIGALVVGLGALISYFRRTQRGADLLSRALAAVGAIVDVLIDRFSALGEKIVIAFNNPRKAVNDFGKTLQEMILNRIAGIAKITIGLPRLIKMAFTGQAKEAAIEYADAIGAIAFGTDKLSESLADVTDEMEKESAAAAALELRTQKLREAEIAFIETKAKLRREIAASRLAVEEEQRAGESLEESNARRYEAAQVGINAQNQLSAIEISLAREKAQILEEQLALGENLTADDRDLAEAKAAIIDLDAQRDETLKRLITRQNAFNQVAKEGNEESTKEAEAALALLEQEKQAISDLNAFKLEQGNELEAAEMERRRRLLEDETLIEEERQLIIAESESRITSIRKKEAEEKMIIDKMVSDNQEALRNQGLSALRSVAAGHTKVAKAAAIAEIFIDTKKAVTKAYTLSPATFGLPWSAVFAAAGIANAAAVSGITPRFEKGGKIGGSLHSNGGTLIEAERDEFVMSRKATAKYGFDFMEKVNNMELNPLTDRGQSNNINIVDVNPIAETLKSMPQNIVQIDGEGFTLSQRRGYDVINQKLNRYST